MEVMRQAKDESCVRIIQLNDPHLAPTSPPSFKADYLEHVKGNIEQVLRHATKIGVDLVLWSGDIFHLKDPKSNPHWLVADVTELFRASAEDGDYIHAGIAGNHDIRFGAIDAGLKGAPLNTLIKAGVYRLLDEETFTIQNKDGSIKVEVKGASYNHGRAEPVRDLKKDHNGWLVTVGHFWLGTQTGDFFGEALFGFDFFKDCDADVICVGHHHEDKGIKIVDGKHYVSHGSIAITGAHPHDLVRRPAAALLSFYPDRIETKLLRPKSKGADELLDLEKHEAIKKEKKEVDAFVESLGSITFGAADPKDVLEQIASTDKVRAKALEYIEAAEQQ